MLPCPSAVKGRVGAVLENPNERLMRATGSYSSVTWLLSRGYCIYPLSLCWALCSFVGVKQGKGGPRGHTSLRFVHVWSRLQKPGQHPKRHTIGMTCPNNLRTSAISVSALPGNPDFLLVRPKTIRCVPLVPPKMTSTKLEGVQHPQAQHHETTLRPELAASKLKIQRLGLD